MDCGRFVPLKDHDPDGDETALQRERDRSKRNKLCVVVSVSLMVLLLLAGIVIVFKARTHSHSHAGAGQSTTPARNSTLELAEIDGFLPSFNNTPAGLSRSRWLHSIGKLALILPERLAAVAVNEAFNEPDATR